MANNLEQTIVQTRLECAETRDRIEHLIERVRAVEMKIDALAVAEQHRREDIQQAIRQALEMPPEGEH